MHKYANYGWAVEDSKAQNVINLLSWVSDVMESRGMGRLVDIDFEQREDMDSLVHFDFKRPNLFQYFFPKLAFSIRESWEARKYRKSQTNV